jgi:hypothetical protein
MPRLRKLKDFSPLDFVQAGEEFDVQTQSQNSSDGSIPPEHGWWSNEAVIASLPDTKLRETYNRYKLLAESCLREITRRHATPTGTRGSDGLDITIGHHRFKRMEPHQTRSVAKKNHNHNQISLTAKQMLQALEMLMKLKEHNASR